MLQHRFKRSMLLVRLFSRIPVVLISPLIRFERISEDDRFDSFIDSTTTIGSIVSDERFAEMSRTIDSFVSTEENIDREKSISTERTNRKGFQCFARRTATERQTQSTGFLHQTIERTGPTSLFLSLSCTSPCDCLVGQRNLRGKMSKSSYQHHGRNQYFIIYFLSLLFFCAIRSQNVF